MHNLKPNSHKYREAQRQKAEERKKLDKVASGVVKKNNSKVRKFAEVFIAEDMVNVKSYIFRDVVIPTIKRALEETLHMVLYGEKGSGKRGNNSVFISYDRFSDKRETRPTSSTTRVGYNFGDIILDTRADAEEVLYQLDAILDEYGVVSVADVYDLVGVSHSYTDRSYGWTNLSTASTMRVPSGYKLKLPRALPIKD